MRLRQTQLYNLNNNFPCRIQPVLNSSEIVVRQFNEPNLPIETSERNMIYVPNWLNINCNTFVTINEVRVLINEAFQRFLINWTE